MRRRTVLQRLPALLAPTLCPCALGVSCRLATRDPDPRLHETRADAAPAWFPGDPTLGWKTVGRSVEGRDLYLADFGTGPDVSLIFGTFHGDEPAAALVATRLAEHIHSSSSVLEPGRRVLIVPVLNPDGLVRRSRRNARGVDLNRNFPTDNWGTPGRRSRAGIGSESEAGPRPGSEPETQLVLALLQRASPRRVLSIHAPLRCNNHDGPAGLRLARILEAHNGYPVEASIGYPTPGSFGTYAGIERGIPMVTLELPRSRATKEAFEAIWEENREALLAFVNAGGE